MFRAVMAEVHERVLKVTGKMLHR